jgi:hypothetical protein
LTFWRNFTPEKKKKKPLPLRKALSPTHTLVYSLTYLLTNPLTNSALSHYYSRCSQTHQWVEKNVPAGRWERFVGDRGGRERMAIIGELFSTVALLSSSPRPCCSSSSLASCIAFVVLVLAVRVCCLFCSSPFVIRGFARSSSWQVHWQ